MTPDASHRGGSSWVVNQDGRIGKQQLPTPTHASTSTLALGHDGGDASERNRLVLSGPTFNPIALRGRGVRQPSETLLEREFSGSRDGEGAQDLAQSRQSMGEHWCSGYTMICIDHH